MQDKAIRYAFDQLSAAGFAVIDPGIAFRLRPDLWATAFNCAADFSADHVKLSAIAERGAASLYHCAVQGLDRRVIVIAVSLDQLAQRIGWITGWSVVAITPWEPQAPAAAVPQVVDGEEIPHWPCVKRTELLAKAGIDDRSYQSSTGLPRPQAGR